MKKPSYVQSCVHIEISLKINLLLSKHLCTRTFVQFHCCKGQLISKGLFAIFTCTKKRTKNFSISAPKNDTFVEVFFFFLKSDLKCGFFRYYYTFSYLFELNISPGILKHKLMRKKYVLEWGSNPQKYYISPGQK